MHHPASGSHISLTTIVLFDEFTEVEHFDRIQHVNQLAEDIENHRQVSAKLREEIGKYVCRELGVFVELTLPFLF